MRNATATDPAPPAGAGAAAIIEAGTAPGRGAENAAPKRGECCLRNKWFFPTHNEHFHSKLSLCLPLSNLSLRQISIKTSAYLSFDTLE